MSLRALLHLVSKAHSAIFLSIFWVIIPSTYSQDPFWPILEMFTELMWSYCSWQEKACLMTFSEDLCLSQTDSFRGLVHLVTTTESCWKFSDYSLFSLHYFIEISCVFLNFFCLFFEHYLEELNLILPFLEGFHGNQQVNHSEH